MINKIKINNFKILKNIDLELGNLNILCGINGMGKSSLIQVLLLLRQSTINEFEVLRLKGDIINLGLAKELLYQFAQDDIIEILLEFDNNKKIFVKTKNYTPNNDYFLLEEPINIKGNKDISLFNNHFQYLEAEHISPMEIYKTSEYNIRTKNLGSKGEYTAHYISSYEKEKIKNKKLIHPNMQNETLIKQTVAWLSEISPQINLSVIGSSDFNNVILKYRYEFKHETTSDFSPINVGFGITYSLPLIVSILTSEKDKLFLFENPESHLHPKGQTKIGEMMALAAEGGSQLIVETHSDHIINGVRVAIKKGLIKPEKVKIFYFDTVIEERELYSIVKELKIDSNGKIDNWPKGFLDEWENNLIELL